MRIMDKNDYTCMEKYQMVVKFSKEKISDFRVDERRKVHQFFIFCDMLTVPGRNPQF